MFRRPLWVVSFERTRDGAAGTVAAFRSGRAAEAFVEEVVNPDGDVLWPNLPAPRIRRGETAWIVENWGEDELLGWDSVHTSAAAAEARAAELRAAALNSESEFRIAAVTVR